MESSGPCFVILVPTRPPDRHTVAKRSPTPKGRPEGPRAKRRDGMTTDQILPPPSRNTWAGVLLSRDECFLSLL